MGNCVGGFRRRTTRISPWKKNKTIVICFLGADGAGKTTIVKALQGEDLGNALPTVGFSRAEFTLNKHKIVSYDLGGASRIRGIWGTYYSEVYGIVYVVDSAAASRVAENQELVSALRGHPDLMHKPILFLLNKKDLPEAMDELHFSELFQLHEMARANKTDIRVEGICAVKGTGKEIDAVIHDSVGWLVERIVANYAVIDRDVAAALKALRKRQAQDRLERQHRLAEMNARQPSSDKIVTKSVEIAMEATQPSTSQLRNGTATASRASVTAETGPEKIASTSTNVPLIMSAPQPPTHPSSLIVQADRSATAEAVTTTASADSTTKKLLSVEEEYVIDRTKHSTANMDESTAKANSRSTNADKTTVKAAKTTANTDKTSGSANKTLANADETIAKADSTLGNADHASSNAAKTTVNADESSTYSDKSTTNTNDAIANADKAIVNADQPTAHEDSISIKSNTIEVVSDRKLSRHSAAADEKQMSNNRLELAKDEQKMEKASTSTSTASTSAENFEQQPSNSQSTANANESTANSHSTAITTAKSANGKKEDGGKKSNSFDNGNRTIFVSRRMSNSATVSDLPYAKQRKRLSNVELSPPTSRKSTAAATKVYARKKSMPHLLSGAKAYLPPVAKSNAPHKSATRVAPRSSAATPIPIQSND